MKTLLLIRHAHRDKPNGRDEDNGLSEKGHLQARAIQSLFFKQYPRITPALLSSPKQRCVETLMPLAKKLDVDIEVMPLLSEGGALKKNTQSFWDWWQKDAPTFVVACSHGDWIPAFVEMTTNARIECRKGSWLELGESVTEPRLVTIIQHPNDFL